MMYELPGPKKSKHPMRSKQNGVLGFTARSGYSLCPYTEGNGIND